MKASMVTVAVSLGDPARSLQLEALLSAASMITLCADVPAGTRPPLERRRRSRARLSPMEQAWARSRRLRPQVLLTSLGCCTAEGGRFLAGLQTRCPQTRVLLLADEPVESAARSMAGIEPQAGQTAISEPDRLSAIPAAQFQLSRDELIFQALQRGAQGVIEGPPELAQVERAAAALIRNEAWVPRRLLTRMLLTVQSQTRVQACIL